MYVHTYIYTYLCKYIFESHIESSLENKLLGCGGGGGDNVCVYVLNVVEYLHKHLNVFHKSAERRKNNDRT